MPHKIEILVKIDSWLFHSLCFPDFMIISVQSFVVIPFIDISGIDG